MRLAPEAFKARSRSRGWESGPWGQYKTPDMGGPIHAQALFGLVPFKILIKFCRRNIPTLTAWWAAAAVVSAIATMNATLMGAKTRRTTVTTSAASDRSGHLLYFL